MTRIKYDHVLWSLKKGNATLDGVSLVNDRGVICEDVRPLVANGYADDQMRLTELGLRLAPDTIHYHTRNKMMKMKSQRFFPQGIWYANGEDKISTYVVDVLISEGDLELLPDLSVQRRHRVRLTVEVFSGEVGIVQEAIKICSPLSRILTPPPATS
jgi:hypothetical protein